MPRNEARDGASDTDDESRGGYRFLGIGMELTAAIVGFSLIGWWIGGKVGGERGDVYGLLIGFALGFAGGMYNLLQATRSSGSSAKR